MDSRRGLAKVHRMNPEPLQFTSSNLLPNFLPSSVPLRLFAGAAVLLSVLLAMVSAARAADPTVFVSAFAPGEQGAIQAHTLDLKPAY